MHRGPFQTPQESSHDAAGAGPALSGRGLRGRARLHSGGGDPTATFLRCPPPTAIICLTSGTALALPPATCPCSSQACHLWSSRSAGRTSTWALWLGAPWPWAGTQSPGPWFPHLKTGQHWFCRRFPHEGPPFRLHSFVKTDLQPRPSGSRV